MVEENPWQQYVDQVMHQLDYDTNQWVKENICSAVAIYGDDGSCWAYSPTFPELTTYTHTVEYGAEKESFEINEHFCCIEATKGVKMPTKAGIKINKIKYMLTHCEDGIAQLRAPKETGAIIGKLNTAVIIALFDAHQ